MRSSDAFPGDLHHHAAATPAATWEAEANKMTKALGAPIPEDNAKKIILYLQAHHTLETRKLY